MNRALLLVAVVLASPTYRLPATRVETATTHNNTKPAGRVDDNRLSLSIELRAAAWQPGGPGTRSIRVFAFAEGRGAPSVPGPLVRVRAGTTVDVSITNRLDRRATVYGFHDHDGHADSVILAPSESRRVVFRAVSPGTFFYRARTTGSGRQIGKTEDSQLSGAFIVDAPAGGVRAHERVMVVTAFDDTVKATGYPDDHFQVFAINGRSWPQTESFSYSVGDSVTWRVINATDHGHPMHLHGFHYSVESRGYELRDTTFAPSERRLAVTEFLRTAATMRISWVASRPGNWLFHCHLIQHIATSLRLDAKQHEHAESHERAQDVMSGLVIALQVRGNAPANTASPSVTRRRMHLFVTEKASANAPTTLGYVLQERGARPSADSSRRPGSTLVLRQGEPTDIVVVNFARRATAIHWHGLELESYYDGVAGWSGSGTRVAPIIAPGDSFIARITPPRAGTFIYHTHVDELTQLPAGLFGAFIVLPNGTTQRDTSERLLFLTDDGLERGSETGRLRTGAKSDSTTIVFRAGTTHRVRIISIGTEATYRVRLLSDSTPVAWRPVAKDGADLPAARAVTQPAIVVMGAGETMDVEIRRSEPERLTLELRKDGVTITRIPVVVQ
jgi:FtsP/CotA-like multicopper oxidase with cupredoxin domain